MSSPMYLSATTLARNCCIDSCTRSNSDAQLYNKPVWYCSTIKCYHALEWSINATASPQNSVCVEGNVLILHNLSRRILHAFCGLLPEKG
jgi:hypothetical protein